jgi:hypothetical protein
MIAAVILAAYQPTAQEITDGRKQLFIWLGILVVLVLLGFGGYMIFVRWMKSSATDEGAGGFSLSDLRAMHKAGKISTEEFEKTKAKMLSAAKRMTESVPSILPKKPGPSKPVLPDEGADSPGSESD